MIKSWKTVSVSASLAIFVLCGMVSAPQAGQLPENTTTTQAAAAPSASTGTAAANHPKAKPAPQQKKRSVLDAEVLESPFSFFKDATAAEDEETELSAAPNTMVIAIKALVATLLSTIM